MVRKMWVFFTAACPVFHTTPDKSESQAVEGLWELNHWGSANNKIFEKAKLKKKM